ncbi:MAG: PIG-L deacetylase family protein [Dehalococcoidia bacterium]
MAGPETATPPTADAAQRALVVMAHPDDIEFTCGGTVANLADDGWEVTFCLVTSGDKGTKDETIRSADLAALREAEQEAAAAVLGGRRCIFLRWPDGFVEDNAELRGALVRVIREVRPALLITWDGYRGFNHRDHRTVGIVALDAAFPLARSLHYFPQHADLGLAYHRVNTVLLAGTREPDYFVDVSRQLDRKIDALRCHASQIKAATRAELVERFQGRMEQAAQDGRVPWAEGFRRLLFGGTTAPRRREVVAAQAKGE